MSVLAIGMNRRVMDNMGGLNKNVTRIFVQLKSFPYIRGVKPYATHTRSRATKATAAMFILNKVEKTNAAPPMPASLQNAV